MKKTAFVFMLLFALALSTEGYSQGAGAGRTAGEQAANDRVSGIAWVGIGCLTGGLSYIYPLIWAPQAPQSALIGQDDAYAAAFADAYEERAKRKMQRNSCVGGAIYWLGCVGYWVVLAGIGSSM